MALTSRNKTPALSSETLVDSQRRSAVLQFWNPLRTRNKMSAAKVRTLVPAKKLNIINFIDLGVMIGTLDCTGEHSKNGR